ncbi:hypothetical protein J6590_096808 [Homalodisca vitripennis]|nr:hypothetical protein J6590_096808 [Homalodisca vitripennis]
MSGAYGDLRLSESRTIWAQNIRGTSRSMSPSPPANAECSQRVNVTGHVTQVIAVPDVTYATLSVSLQYTFNIKPILDEAWPLLGWVTAKQSCPCKQPACLGVGGGSKVTFKPLVPSNWNTRRGASLLSIPVHRSSIYSKSFTVSACRLWNNLPDHIRGIRSRERFRGVLRDHLFWASSG